eukprot:5812859-Amphidinium_carterae.1
MRRRRPCKRSSTGVRAAVESALRAQWLCEPTEHFCVPLPHLFSQGFAGSGCQRSKGLWTCSYYFQGPSECFREWKRLAACQQGRS